jgi:DNA repair exonuclease SbcCD ATPase subunit
MYIKFDKVRYKNILSVGNAMIEIALSADKTVLLAGTNGTGKSTAIEAIIFALYGKPFRKISKTQLVNSVNKKDMLVEIEFTAGPSKYLVRRGIKPNLFEIWCDGQLINKDAASRDYQQYLEQNVLMMSMKSACQIMILGNATYIPFMDLPAGQRREIVEDLLDIQVFSTMNVLLKEQISDNKQSLLAQQHVLETLNVKIESAEKHQAEILKIKQTQVNNILDKIAALEQAKQLCERRIDEMAHNLQALQNTISDRSKCEATATKIGDLTRDLQTKLIALQSEKEFYKNHDNCPTCRQNIDGRFKHDASLEIDQKVEQLRAAVEQLGDKQRSTQKRLEEIASVVEQISAVKNSIVSEQLTATMLANQIKSHQHELLAAEKQVKNVAVDNAALAQYISEKASAQQTLTDLLGQREVLGIVGSMLKDGGIKTAIVQTYIPVINKLINQFLSQFELFVDFHFDENFNETIRSRFRDSFTFASFSEGEKMRISLSVMFAWREIARARNSVSTNLLIMDEVLDSSSDAAGIESLIDILLKMNEKDNVFVISHRSDSFAEKFGRTIEFEKYKGFTQIKQ